MEKTAKGLHSESMSPTSSSPRPGGVTDVVCDLDAAFRDVLEASLADINTFVRDQQSQNAAKREELSAVRAKATSLDELRAIMIKEQELWKESDELREFAAVNHTAFFKIAKKHDKVVGGILPVMPAGALSADLASTFMPHVEAQSFIRILHNENPLDERVVDQPELLKMYKDQLKTDLKTAYSLACGAITDILPRGVMSSVDMKDLAEELQKMYDITITDIMTHIRMCTEAQLRQRIEASKHRLFQRMVARVRSALEQQYPETASALGKLERVHNKLFLEDGGIMRAVSRRRESMTNGGSGGPPALSLQSSASSGLFMSTASLPDIPRLSGSMSELGLPTPTLPMNSPSLAPSISNFTVQQDGSQGSLGTPSIPHSGSSIHDRIKSHAKHVAKEAFKPLIPKVLDWGRHYKLANLKGDVIAACTIAAVAIPQGLAYARLAEVNPIHGIYGMMFPSVMYALWGTSRQAGIGPQSIPALLIGSAVTSLTSDPAERLGYVLTVTMIVGLLCLLFGLLRLGFIVSFISRPVLNGFASAAAIITTVSVLKEWLRTSPAKGSNVFVNIFNLLASFSSAHVPSFILGALALACLVALKKHPRTAKLPGALIVMILFLGLMAAWHAVSGPDTVMPNGGVRTSAGVKIIGEVEMKFPSPTFPDLATFGLLFQTALFAMFVGFIESIAVAKTYSLANGYEIDASQELVALGAANMVGSMFQTIPAMAGFGMSAINASSGAKTQLAQLISGCLVGVLVVIFQKVIYFLPNAVLSSIIIMSVSKLVDYNGAKTLWKQDKSDLAVMACSFLATLLFGVQTGVLIAMLFSLMLFIWRSTRPVITELGRIHGSVAYAELGQENVYRVRAAKVIRFGAPLFFANVPLMKDRMSEEITHRKTLASRYRWYGLVLDFSNVSSIDSTALSVMGDIVSDFQSRGLRLCFANVSQSVRLRMVTSGLVTKIDDTNIFNSIQEAVRFIVEEREAKKAAGRRGTPLELQVHVDTPSLQPEGKRDPLPQQASAMIGTGHSLARAESALSMDSAGLSSGGSINDFQAALRAQMRSDQVIVSAPSAPHPVVPRSPSSAAPAMRDSSLSASSQRQVDDRQLTQPPA